MPTSNPNELHFDDNSDYSNSSERSEGTRANRGEEVDRASNEDVKQGREIVDSSDQALFSSSSLDFNEDDSTHPSISATTVAFSNLRDDERNAFSLSGSSGSYSFAGPTQADSSNATDSSRVNVDDRLAPGDTRVPFSGGASTTAYLPSFDGLDVSVVDALPDEWNDASINAMEHSLSSESLAREDDITVISGHSDSSEADDDAGVLKPGSKFGQFTILRYIGGGGMGRVYEGEDCDLERKVAIKVLPRKRAQDAGTVARFLNEAKSSARLNHENIAQVYLFGNVDGVPYIAFEYIEGVNLRDYVRENGVLKLSESIDYVLQAAAALAHAASHGVTHRDVKPSNIIITPQKRVKLIDMGLARLLKPQYDEDLTESGVTLGTFDYISPEQALDPRHADVRSDVYSLGCTFYYMLTGAPPYPEGTMLQKLLKHQGDNAPDVRDLNPEVPVEVAAVVKKMMKKEPKERYQTPNALISDLYEIADMIGVHVANRSYSEPTSKAKEGVRSEVWRLPGVCAVLTFVLLVLGYYFFSEKNDLVLPEIKSSALPSAPNTVKNEDVGETSAPSDVAYESDDLNLDVSLDAPSNITGDALTGSSANNYELDLDAELLDSLYSAAYPFSFSVGPAGVSSDDNSDWRNTYIEAGDVAVSKRVAYGWRSHGGNLSSASLSISSYSETEFDNSSLSFVAYSSLGNKTDSETLSNTPADIWRIVDRTGKAPNTYSTLQAALASVSSREQTETREGVEVKNTINIVLQFNGSLATSSISFDGQRVNIVAGENYSPTLSFEPPDSPNGAGGERMFLLNDSDVSLVGVAIDFTVPSQDVVAAEEWSVFEGSGSSTLSMRSSTLTVCNMAGEAFSSPLHSNVAFFRTRDNFSYDDISQTDVESRFDVDLEKTFVRGEGDLFVTERAGTSLDAINCGFNISGSVMCYRESRYDRRSDRLRFNVVLDNTLVICQDSLTSIDSDDFQIVPTFDVSIKESIVRLKDRSLAFIQSPTPFVEDAFAGFWHFNQAFVFDATSFYRCRVDNSEPIQEYPFQVDSELSRTLVLSEFDSDISAGLDDISPHSFSLADFTQFLLTPIRSSTTLPPSLKTIVEMIETNFLNEFK